MTTPDTENSNPLLTQTNPAETKKKNRRFAVVLYFACVFGGTLIEGWVKVFIGLSVAPIETLAFQFGIAVAPFVVSWIIAKVVSLAFKKISFNITWGVGAVFIMVLMIVGRQGTETSVATSRDTTAQPSAKTSATDAELRKTCYNAMSTQQWNVAVQACTTLATRGDANAQYNLGVIYGEGLGVKQDNKEAVRWYTLAVERNNADAQSNLGVMYKEGRGVAQDDKEAVRWYRLAANQKLGLGQYNLGLMYDLGRGVPQDYAQAVSWYALAAAQGNADAQYNLALMHYEGQGVAQDYVRTHMWFNLAAMAGAKDSIENRDIVASKMTQEQIAKAQQMATDCKAKNYKAC